eukprot:353919-Chlamydomonas_euryale.AAC.1
MGPQSPFCQTTLGAPTTTGPASTRCGEKSVPSRYPCAKTLCRPPPRASQLTHRELDMNSPPPPPPAPSPPVPPPSLPGPVPGLFHSLLPAFLPSSPPPPPHPLRHLPTRARAQAARFMDAAAHGGQIVCEESVAEAVLAQFRAHEPPAMTLQHVKHRKLSDGHTRPASSASEVSQAASDASDATDGHDDAPVRSDGVGGGVGCGAADAAAVRNVVLLQHPRAAETPDESCDDDELLLALPPTRTPNAQPPASACVHDADAAATTSTSQRPQRPPPLQQAGSPRMRAAPAAPDRPGSVDMAVPPAVLTGGGRRPPWGVPPTLRSVSPYGLSAVKESHASRGSSNSTGASTADETYGGLRGAGPGADCDLERFAARPQARLVSEFGRDEASFQSVSAAAGWPHMYFTWEKRPVVREVRAYRTGVFHFKGSAEQIPMVRGCGWCVRACVACSIAVAGVGGVGQE